MNSITLGNLPTYDAPEGGRATNEFIMCSGGNRYGVGRFLMKRWDYEILVANADTDGCVDLVMSSALLSGTNATEKSTVTFKVVVAGCTPYAVSVGALTSGRTKDMVDVIVYDRRFFQTPVSGSYNVTLPDLSGFYASTLSGGTTEYTWSSLITALGFSAATTNVTLPSWKPRNMLFEQVSSGQALDVIAAALRVIVGYNPYQLKSALYDINAQDSVNAGLLGDSPELARFRISGAPSVKNGQKLPGTVNVVFKKVVPGASDPYAAGYYTYGYTPSYGAPSLIFTTAVGEYLALMNGATVTNQAELDAVAADVALRELTRLSYSPAEYTFLGFQPFVLDGQIRAIKWTGGRHGAFTTIRMHNDRGFDALDDVTTSIMAIANNAVHGVSGAIGALALSGTRLLFPAAGTPALFPVALSSDGGSAGSGTAACTFTYTVLDLSGGTLGTGVTPLMQRPTLGKTTAAVTGLAFNNGGSLTLAWCDEVPDRVKRVCT